MKSQQMPGEEVMELLHNAAEPTPQNVAQDHRSDPQGSSNIIALSRKVPFILAWPITPIKRRATIEGNAASVGPVVSSPPLGSHS